MIKDIQMNSLKSKNGLTMAELLVAALIVGIIMLGIVSIDLALRQSEQGSSRNALVASRTSALMLHIVKNIELATGDARDPGIAVDTSTPGSESLWVRLEGAAPATPGDYTDDNWFCYTAVSNTLRYCNPADSSTPCNAGNENLGPISSFTPALIEDSDSTVQNFYIEVELQNLFDNSSAEDHLDNPRYTLKSRIYPLSHSSILP